MGEAMTITGAVFTIIGGLDAFPRRLAAREIGARGGAFRRGLSRRTDILVFGHRAIYSWSQERILSRLKDAKTFGARPISENAFLRFLGLRGDRETPRQLSRHAMIDESGLASEIFDVLALFDAFEVPHEPFGFSDLVAAKQFVRLLENGAEWSRVVRAVQSAGHTRTSSLRLECSDWNDVVARTGSSLTELDGQQILSLSHSDVESVDALFDEAE